VGFERTLARILRGAKDDRKKSWQQSGN